MSWLTSHKIQDSIVLGIKWIAITHSPYACYVVSNNEVLEVDLLPESISLEELATPKSAVTTGTPPTTTVSISKDKSRYFEGQQRSLIYRRYTRPRHVQRREEQLTVIPSRKPLAILKVKWREWSIFRRARAQSRIINRVGFTPSDPASEGSRGTFGIDPEFVRSLATNK